MVPEGGLEPPQGCPYRILSPARLPFHHSGTRANIDNEHELGLQEERKKQCWGGEGLRTHNSGLSTYYSVLSEKQFPAVPERGDSDQLGMFDMLQLYAVARRQDTALET